MPSPTKIPAISIIIHVLVLHRGTHSLSLPQNVTVPAIFFFGDSVVDPGNSDWILSVCRADHPPYGRDFEGGIATGRFSNAKIPSDYAAQEFGVKELLPAYLDISLRTKDLLTGVSFAFTCSGYDPITSLIFQVPTLTDQLQHFREWQLKVKTAVGGKKASYVISESVYLVVAGNNDFTFNYYGSLYRSLQYNVSSYCDLLLTFASTFLQELYNLGARRIGVIGLPPQGCLPAMRTSAEGHSRPCNKQYNQNAMLFNSKLESLMGSLGKNLPGAKLVYLDLYGSLLQLVKNPEKFGFTIANRGCCGQGETEVSFICSPFDPRTCKNDSKYVFWDAYHPTDAACKIIVHKMLSKTINKFF
ncbi:hypothetical protein Droror1_Dr00022080 [Drosera rotundifolia]